MSKPAITIYGATGYTGRLIAQRCRRAGLPVRLAGRDAAALAALAAALTPETAPLVADPARPATLAPLVSGSALLINAAGPFSAVGPALAQHAAERGVHYLDLSNEIDAVAQVAALAPLAASNGAALLPACGLEIAVADAALALLGGAPQRITVGYAWPGMRTRRGARHTMADLIGARHNAVRNGRLVWRWPAAHVAAAPGALLRLGGGELWSAPLRAPPAAVDVGLLCSPASAQALALLVPWIRTARRSPLRALLNCWVDRLFPPLTDEEGGFVVRCIADGATITVRGPAPYRTTAEIVGLAAERVLGGFAGRGACPPSAVLPPDELFAALSAHGVTVEHG